MSHAQPQVIDLMHDDEEEEEEEEQEEESRGTTIRYPLLQSDSGSSTTQTAVLSCLALHTNIQQHLIARSMAYFVGDNHTACAAWMQAPLCQSWLSLAQRGYCVSQRCFLLGHRKQQPGGGDAWLLRARQVAMLPECNPIFKFRAILAICPRA